MKERTTISIRKTDNGYLELTTIYRDHLVRRLYIGYSQREAVRRFKEVLKTEY